MTCGLPLAALEQRLNSTTLGFFSLVRPVGRPGLRLSQSSSFLPERGRPRCASVGDSSVSNPARTCACQTRHGLHGMDGELSESRSESCQRRGPKCRGGRPALVPHPARFEMHSFFVASEIVIQHCRQSDVASLSLRGRAQKEPLRAELSPAPFPPLPPGEGATSNRFPERAGLSFSFERPGQQSCFEAELCRSAKTCNLHKRAAMCDSNGRQEVSADAQMRSGPRP
ncbi:hypothetical protein LX36DRAFT_480302 [Colletotrichum falcatum]|nr:hypothetical protein LX36DRAFT_480302 [Colletotrichum falcatum]